MKAVVFTLGCKVNEVESAKIMAALESNGWQVFDSLQPADVYVLNTCAVTKEAEKKSRQLVARAKKFNPQAQIFVCGCASQKDKTPFMLRGAQFVAGTADRGRVVEEILNLFGGKPYTGFPKHVKTRAFIKIQDGCNNFCSYCIIPYLRGREVSRPPEDILDEVLSTACPEVVLTGINISSYGKDFGGLTGLISRLKDVKKRIRLGSLECTAVDEGLLCALSELEDFAPQFHLSLQSGSDRVLKSMNRHYTRAEYLGKCALIKKFFPQAAITTDIICGFPTEEEGDFADTLSIIKEAGFARVHAFPFSPREGTVAYRMKDLPAEVKSARMARLLSAAKAAEVQYVSGFAGKILDFIAEEYIDGHTVGYTANYIRVYVPKQLESGKKYAVKILSPHLDGAIAEVLYEGTV